MQISLVFDSNPRFDQIKRRVRGDRIQSFVKLYAEFKRIELRAWSNKKQSDSYYYDYFPTNRAL